MKFDLSVVLVAVVVNLRRSIVGRPEVAGSGAALSIYPDPSNYVDADGYERQVADLIAHSNGGVVGITGVRGAGKSALLAKIKDRFQDQYCVVWTVAPVSHRDDLSFLMSICRTLCQKAIDDAGDILFSPARAFQKAGEEFLRRVRIPAAQAAAIAFVFVAMQGDGGAPAAFFESALPTPPVYRFAGNEIQLDRSAIGGVFQTALADERLTIRRIVARMDAVLGKAGAKGIQAGGSVDKSVRRFAIVPLARHRGFDLIEAGRSNIDPEVLRATHRWLSFDIRALPSLNKVGQDYSGIIPMPTERDSLTND